MSLAIEAALSSSFQKAIKINTEIIKKNPHDIEALNRMAYAYLELGKKHKAQIIYKKVLKIDPYNPIAVRNSLKLKDFRQGSCGNIPRSSIASLFLEEPGKTKVVSLVKVGMAAIITNLRPGNCLIINPKKHYITINDENNRYVGSLPDDLSFRLLDFMRKGNKYEAFVRSVGKNCVSIFIKETFRSARLKNVVSFTTKLDNQNFPKSNRAVCEEEGEKETGDDIQESEAF